MSSRYNYRHENKIYFSGIGGHAGGICFDVIGILSVFNVNQGLKMDFLNNKWAVIVFFVTLAAYVLAISELGEYITEGHWLFQ
ncbi:hypothetical protein ACQPT2_17475 [Erwinia amylovora]